MVAQRTVLTPNIDTSGVRQADLQARTGFRIGQMGERLGLGNALLQRQIERLPVTEQQADEEHRLNMDYKEYVNKGLEQGLDIEDLEKDIKTLSLLGATASYMQGPEDYATVRAHAIKKGVDESILPPADAVNTENFEEFKNQLTMGSLYNAEMFKAALREDAAEQRRIHGKAMIKLGREPKEGDTFEFLEGTKKMGYHYLNGRWNKTEGAEGTGFKKGKGGDKGFGIKSSDSNAIGRQVTTLFGGRYSPTTGEFMGLKKEVAQDAQAVRTVAERIFLNGGGEVTHAEAVTKAANSMGIKIRTKEEAAEKAAIDKFEAEVKSKYPDAVKEGDAWFVYKDGKKFQVVNE